MTSRNLFPALTLYLTLAGCGGDKVWSDRALKTVTGTVDGTGFTIEVPDGMHRTDEPTRVQFDFEISGRTKTPDITVNTDKYAPTLDDFIKSEPNVTNWVRKDALPDGYIATYENSSYKGREDYLVYVHRVIGGKSLTCSARVTPWTKGATTKDKLPALEKICLSLKPN